ncbi:MAG: uroporphyrinogen decarboxylase family protein [Candidatus Methylomirabilales bacterium]
MQMTKGERILAAVEGRAVDRPPVSFWRHFPQLDEDPVSLAEALITFHTRYDLDFIKVMPTGVYCVEDWGCRVAYRGALDGSKVCIDHAIKSSRDWERIRPLDPEKGALGRELACLRRVVKERRDDAPILQTLFSPLTIAKKLAGDQQFLTDLRERPALIHGALEVITETMSRYAAACLEAGGDGIFFATQMAPADLLTVEEYRTFAEPYDRRILELVAARSRFSVLHVHGLNVRFEVMAAYPTAAINWHDRRTAPSLREARGQFQGAVVGGLNEVQTLREGPEEAVRAEVQDALRQTAGRGHIVAPGCVVPLDVPEAHLRAVRATVEEWQ